MTCGIKTTKFLLYWSTALVALGAAGLINEGAMITWGKYSELSHAFNPERSHQMRTDATIVFIIGIVVFSIAIFGFFSAVKESYRMLIASAVMYFPFLIIGVVIECFSYKRIREEYSKHYFVWMYTCPQAVTVFGVLCAVLSLNLASFARNERKRQKV